jgi:chorismate dehydratase
MVYAVWAVRRDVLASHPAAVQAALDALVRAQAWGVENLERVVAAAQRVRPRPAGYYASYYATLNFAFDARARVGLKRYFAELHALGAIDAVASVEPEVFLVPR